MENNKKKWHDWLFLYPGIACLLIYGGLFVVVITVGYIVFTQFNLFQTEPNSARYMLSALVQCQAAIVAIVITLTLIAVQITASAYSPRVVDAFRNNRDMRILLGSYAISIFYGLIVLKLIKGIEGEVLNQRVTLPFYHNSIPFEYFVSFALWLGAFSFAALFPYILRIIDLLKPANIIQRLSGDITGDKISNYIVKSSKGDETSAVEDPIQPIVDIIYGALRKHDLETARKGLREIVELVIKVINTEEKEKKEGKISFYSGYICSHLQRVGKFAASIADEESTKEAIIYLEKFGRDTVKKDLKEATEQVVMSLRAVGEAAVEEGLETAARQVAFSLEAVGKAAAEKGKELEEVTQKIIWSLKAIGKAAAEGGLEEVTTQAVLSLSVVGEAAAEGGLERATWMATRSLEAVEKAAVEEGLEEATTQIALSLGDLGRIAVKNKLKVAKEQAIKALLAAGAVTVEKELEAAARQAALSLAVLTILSKENVKTMIQEYESKLKESDRRSFQKFKKLYEQEFEK